MAQLKATEIIKLKKPNSFNETKKKRMKRLKAMKMKQNEMSNDYNPICWRFPSLKVCGCTRPCRESVKSVQIFEIINGLFVGPVHGAFNCSLLKSKKIKKILNVLNESYFLNEDDFNYLQIEIEDAVTTQIIKYFEQSNEFIDNALSQGIGVYVHCRAGISRSPSFICAYLMWKQSISYKKADKIIGRVHPFANPNSSFVRQLQEYEKMLQMKQMFKISKDKQLNQLAINSQNNGSIMKNKSKTMSEDKMIKPINDKQINESKSDKNEH